MTRFVQALSAAAMLAGVAGAPAPAWSADPVLVDVEPTVCAEDQYLSRIEKRFAYQVKHVPNLPDVRIAGFYDIREQVYEPSDEFRPISRRYCSATVTLDNSESRSIWYLIETDQGFASIGENVEFCVNGFDRWMIYNGACRILRK
ncbi:MAG: hypothetical protein DI629_15210 [Mesorhizobium amorphae]|nr:MAG: hypothetical protein DI629_15210 [Mesorhizobium amorphae]